MNEINKLAALQGGEINEAKKVLATEGDRAAARPRRANTASETARADF